ncbi:cobB/CobQ glutamine amidotransferase domain protein [Burkholderia pseudomallei MSHR2990]|nr:cobB/CobQ glutamine amidotransferase domain protein [Burkholderia pseudomallei MSHR2990]
MQIRRDDRPVPIHRFARRAVVRPRRGGDGRKRRREARVVERVARHRAEARRERLHAERGETPLHRRVAGHEAEHRRRHAVRVRQRIAQIQHAAAFGDDAPARRDVRGDRARGRRVRREPRRMQLRIAARQIERVRTVGHRLVGKRREERELGAERFELIEIRRIDERERRVARDRDPAADEARHGLGRLGRANRADCADCADCAARVGRRRQRSVAGPGAFCRVK